MLSIEFSSRCETEYCGYLVAGHVDDPVGPVHVIPATVFCFLLGRLRLRVRENEGAARVKVSVYVRVLSIFASISRGAARHIRIP